MDFRVSMDSSVYSPEGKGRRGNSTLIFKRLSSSHSAQVCFEKLIVSHMVKDLEGALPCSMQDPF
jgi:hypothetical protein